MNFVKVENIGKVAKVTICNEKALNAMNTEILQEIADTFAAINPEEVHCVVLTGQGNKAFVAGADIAEMATKFGKEGEIFGQVGNKAMRNVEICPVPVIAAVNGFALGGGNELAMASDIRLCSANAVFAQPEASLGITPGFGGTQRLGRVLGSMSMAKEILYTGRNVKADEALKIGLVNAVYDTQEELMEAAMKLAERIANNAPFAVRACKRGINEGIEMPMEKAMLFEAQLFGSCFDTQDQKDRMEAFLNKSKK